MKYNEVMKVKHGTGLLVNGKSFRVHRVSNYKCRTASWLNLIMQTPDGEKVLELSDGGIRLWEQVFDLLDVSPATESVDYRGHHFEVDESRVRAKTTTRNVEGTEEIQEDSITSVYVDESDESVILSIETKGEKLFVWYSDKMISPKNIKMSK